MSDPEDGEIADSRSDLSGQDTDEERYNISDVMRCDEQQHHSDEEHGALISTVHQKLPLCHRFRGFG